MISVIIPVYNNQDTLCELNNEIESALGDIREEFEIIYINDASTDNSSSILNEILSKNSRIIVINNRRNDGQNNSILTGLKNSSGEKIVVLDADLQDQPKYIPILIHKLKSPFDIVFALRAGSYESISRLYESRLFKFIVYMLTGLPVSAGTYFVISQIAKEKLLRYKFQYPYITIMLVCSKLRFTGVGVIRNKRTSQGSSYTFMNRLKLAFWCFYCLFYIKFFDKR